MIRSDMSFSISTARTAIPSTSFAISATITLMPDISDGRQKRFRHWNTTPDGVNSAGILFFALRGGGSDVGDDGLHVGLVRGI